MKFKKPTQKNAIDKVVQALSLGTGVVLSKGAMSMLPAEYQTNMYKGGMALISLVVSAIIKGESTFDKGVQMAFVGMGVQQGVEALSSEIGKQLNVDPNATGGQKFLQASLGLGSGVATPLNQAMPLLAPSVWQQKPTLQAQEQNRISVDDMSA